MKTVLEGLAIAIAQRGAAKNVRIQSVDTGGGDARIDFPYATIEVEDDRRARDREQSSVRIGDIWKVPDYSTTPTSTKYVYLIAGSARPQPDDTLTDAQKDEWFSERVGEVRQYERTLDVLLTISIRAGSENHQVVDAEGNTWTYPDVRTLARRAQHTLIAYEVDGASRDFLPDPRTASRLDDGSWVVPDELNHVRNVLALDSRDRTTRGPRGRLREYEQRVRIDYVDIVDSLETEGEFPIIETVIAPGPDDLRGDTSEEWPGEIVFTPPGITPSDLEEDRTLQT